jgi:hypothetical protein
VTTVEVALAPAADAAATGNAGATGTAGK